MYISIDIYICGVRVCMYVNVHMCLCVRADVYASVNLVIGMCVCVVVHGVCYVCTDTNQLVRAGSQTHSLQRGFKQCS